MEAIHRLSRNEVGEVMSMPVLPAVCCIVVEITVKLLYGEDSVPTVNDPNYPGQKIKLYWDHFKRMFIAGARPVS